MWPHCGCQSLKRVIYTPASALCSDPWLHSSQPPSGLANTANWKQASGRSRSESRRDTRQRCQPSAINTSMLLLWMCQIQTPPFSQVFFSHSESVHERNADSQTSLETDVRDCWKVLQMKIPYSTLCKRAAVVPANVRRLTTKLPLLFISTVCMVWMFTGLFIYWLSSRHRFLLLSCKKRLAVTNSRTSKGWSCS